jgi:hypothetical protein
MSTAALTLACLLLAGNASEPPPEPINQRSFTIPVQLNDPAHATEIKELTLLVSRDQGKTWTPSGNAKPEAGGFAFVAPADGVYWFSVQVVDQAGKRTPANPFDVVPNRKVLVDTTRPELKNLSAERRGADVLVRWEVKDDNLKLDASRLEYHLADAPPDTWVPVPIPNPTLMQASFEPTGPAAITLRLRVEDAAKNFAVETFQLAGSGGTVAVPPPPPPPATFPDTTVPTRPVVSPAEQGWGPTATQPTSFQRDPPARPALDKVDPPAPPPPPPATFGADSRAGGSGKVLLASGGGQIGEAPPITAPTREYPSGGAATSGPQVQYVNSRRLTLDYQVSRLGASGVSTVEVYLTRDEGKSWEKWQTNEPGGTDVKPLGGGVPASFDGTGSVPPPDARPVGSGLRRSVGLDVPADGAYGFYLVVRSGVGLGKPPPAPGTPPQVRLVVDTLPPKAGVYEPQVDPTQHDAVVISWKAEDLNLTARPVTLEWTADRSDPARPWKPVVAEPLPAQPDHFVWHPPQDVPGRVFLRVKVADLAGNVTCVETPGPVVVDLVEPEVTNVGVSRPGAPQ